MVLISLRNLVGFVVLHGFICTLLICMQENDDLNNKNFKLVYPSGKEITLPSNSVLESKTFEKYLTFLKAYSDVPSDKIQDYDMEIDLNGVNFYNNNALDEPISDNSFDNFFNLLKNFKYNLPLDDQIKCIFLNLINKKLSLRSRLDIINLVEFLAVDNLIYPCAGALAHLFSRYDYLQNMRYDENFFNKILYLQAPYIKKLAGIALMRVESCDRSRIGTLLNKLIIKDVLDNYKHVPKIKSFSKDGMLFLLDNCNSINVIELDKSNKVKYLDKVSFNCKISAIAFDPEHSCMAVALKNRLINIFKKGKEGKFLRVFKNNNIKRLPEIVNVLKISDNNKYLAAISNYNLYIISLDKGVILLETKLAGIDNKAEKLCRSIDFVKDNEIILASNTGQIFSIAFDNHNYSESNEECTFVTFNKNLLLDLNDVISYTLHPNKNFLAIHLKNNYICLYDLKNKAIIHEFKCPYEIINLSFSPDGTEFSYIIGLSKNGQLFLFDIYTKQIILDLKIKKRYINSFICYNNGSNLLITLSNGLLKNIDLSAFRNFILNNEYFFEHMLLLLSIFNKEKFYLQFEKNHVGGLFNSLPANLQLALYKY